MARDGGRSLQEAKRARGVSGGSKAGGVGCSDWPRGRFRFELGGQAVALARNGLLTRSGIRLLKNAPSFASTGLLGSDRWAFCVPSGRRPQGARHSQVCKQAFLGLSGSGITLLQINDYPLEGN